VGLFGLFLWMYKDRLKAGVAVFISFLLFYFFGAFHDFLQKNLGKTFLVRYVFLMPILGLVYIAVLRSVKRKVIAPKFIFYLNVLTVFFIMMDTVTIIGKAVGRAKMNKSLTVCTACDKPDVYFIIVDGYAGNEQIINDFSDNNRPFSDSLQMLGFRVLSHSRSNYERTEFSMASMLNMDYHPLSDFTVSDSSLEYCFKQIAKNKVVDAFHQQGYAFVNNSIFDIDGQASPVNNNFLIKGTNLIESETLLARLRRDVYIPFLMKYMQNSELYKDFLFQPYYSDSTLVNRLEVIMHAKADRPRFVYTHLLMTHFPYYFQENGQLNNRKDIRVDNYSDKKLYLSNLKYTNQRLLSLLRKLLQSYKKPPVIILASDHGFRYAERPALAFSNLMAVYLPGEKNKQFYDSVSSVNQFRLLFNVMFRQDLPLLEDRVGQRAQLLTDGDSVLSLQKIK
jgi:hypothetical protein